MEMDHFIESVRKYPCLWNANAIEYRDQELKDAAWAEVMKETDLSSVKEVKQKWKKLRDSYRDALKRQSEMLAREPGGGGGGASKKSYPWKYMGAMHFLQPYMNVRRRQAAAAAARSTLAPSGPPCSSGDSSSEAAPSPAKRRRSSGAPAAPAGPARPPDPLDPLDIFFNSMCQSTKLFPFQTQIQIKRTLFEAVIRAEESLLGERRPPRFRASASSPASEPDDAPA